MVCTAISFTHDSLGGLLLWCMVVLCIAPTTAAVFTESKLGKKSHARGTAHLWYATHVNAGHVTHFTKVLLVIWDTYHLWL